MLQIQEGEFFTGPAIHCPIFNEIGCKVPEKVYLAILNSNLFWFFISHTSTALRGNAYRLTPEFITRFSFPDLDGNENNELLIKLVDQMITAQEQLDSAISNSDKKFLQQRVDILDKQINTVVYGLYGLTADEVKIVEGGVGMNNSENIFSVIENGDKLESHYSFGNDDDTHALNAYIRNACEKEFLGIIKTLSAELGIHVNVEAEAKKEGSIREIYNFLLSESGIAITA